ncbi:MAG: OB-fold domain-containing protein [Pseudomonadota bacterium]
MADRPQPTFPESHTELFWQGIKKRELRFQTCDDCARVVFYPRHHCPYCLAASLSWQVSAGLGTVYTFAVIRQNRVPAFIEFGAYPVAYIDLDEGFRMMSTVVGIEDPTSDIHIGQRVQVEFEAQDTGEYPIPVFRPVTDSG